MYEKQRPVNFKEIFYDSAFVRTREISRTVFFKLQCRVQCGYVCAHVAIFSAQHGVCHTVEIARLRPRELQVQTVAVPLNGEHTLGWSQV